MHGHDHRSKIQLLENEDLGSCGEILQTSVSLFFITHTNLQLFDGSILAGMTQLMSTLACASTPAVGLMLGASA